MYNLLKIYSDLIKIVFKLKNTSIDSFNDSKTYNLYHKVILQFLLLKIN